MSDQFVDEFGFRGPLPITSTQRILPEPGFEPGLEIGEQAPDFQLLDQHGETVSLHAALSKHAAALSEHAAGLTALFFFRSAVW